MTTHYDWTRPTARTRHRCGLCYRVILPGEDYDRMAGMVDGSEEPVEDNPYRGQQ